MQLLEEVTKVIPMILDWLKEIITGIPLVVSVSGAAIIGAVLVIIGKIFKSKK